MCVLRISADELSYDTCTLKGTLTSLGSMHVSWKIALQTCHHTSALKQGWAALLMWTNTLKEHWPTLDPYTYSEASLITKVLRRYSENTLVSGLTNEVLELKLFQIIFQENACWFGMFPNIFCFLLQESVSLLRLALVCAKNLYNCLSWNV